MINNPTKFMEGIWDWDFISEVLPSKIKVSDVDGIIERNGWVLCIETKSEEVETIPKGQFWMYESLVKNGTTTVIFLFGEKDKPRYMQLMCQKKWGKVSKYITLTEKTPCNISQVQNIVDRWFKKANERKVNHNQDIQF